MVLLWSVEALATPTWRNLNSSFESWAYRNGFGKRLEYLAKERFLEKQRQAGTQEWVIRLTERGRLAGLGGRDPERCWKRPWDGVWRMVLFDLPQRDRQLRMRLWRWLRANHFGYLQNSLWIVPDLDDELTREWSAKHSNVEAFAVFEGRPVRGASDAEVVAGAWDFEEINQAWHRYRAHLDRVPLTEGQALPWREALLDWIGEERALWKEAIRGDPLLPERLLPTDYEGQTAWRHRREVWSGLSREMRDAGKE
ncbi:MAG: phenylacetic acid degradation operon negative regulatory protein [Chthoniobacter sp.]|nr:phenylacetic acid degradation operon negative regulatory protein [Chthoniobacter sp.]